MAEILARLSDDLAQIVVTAGPVVVRVEARKRLSASGIVWSQDGIVVTAHHVVEREDDIMVGLPDGRAVPAALVGRDPATDIAVLRAQADGLTPPKWAAPDGVRVGHLVLALGRPGRGVTATLGIVSALGVAWRSPAGGRLDRYLQSDVMMYPGFSGGPLVDAAGRVLGLNSSALLRGIALAVPTPTLTQVVEELVFHGRIARGYLGVGAQPVRLPATLAQQLGQETGLLLVSVEAGSPAEQGGLLLGDTVLALNGQPTRLLDDLLAQLTGDRVGVSLPVRILRGGQMQEQAVVVRERP